MNEESAERLTRKEAFNMSVFRNRFLRWSSYTITIIVAVFTIMIVSMKLSHDVEPFGNCFRPPDNCQ